MNDKLSPPAAPVVDMATVQAGRRLLGRACTAAPRSASVGSALERFEIQSNAVLSRF